ncbi:MAG TPA: trifunctional glycosyltransferase/class I SAM-dependent methyltransferase/polysaccharide deacetylase [Solirubrobacteraceae bacterium]
MQSKTTMISVVVPAYNRESTITRSLDSLLQQTHGGWEAIIVDDGSHDGTADVAEAYARRDRRFRVHRQTNGGVSAARNAGIALARHPWLFFLDADDWITDSALAVLLAAATAGRAQVDAVYAGYIRIDEEGNEIRERRPHHDEDLFPVFTRMCAFAIHTCLIGTDLVRSTGGFDETLVTCEDWDLWQRIARTGARFVAIPDYIAYYRMRSGSASADGARMLGDGLRVIERGHTEDTRLAAVNPVHRHGAPPSAEPLARTYFACYAAGLVMASGADARWMLDALGEIRPTDLSADGIAETLFFAVPNGRASAPNGWSTFPAEVLERCREFIDAMGRWMGDSWLSFQARRGLERLMLGAIEGSKPRTVGAWHLMEVDCAGDPPRHLFPGGIVEHVLCAVRLGSYEIGAVELPACDGWVSPRILADRVADEFAWEVLRAWLAQRVYPTLEVSRSGSSARVMRAGVTLLEQEVPSGYEFDQWLHDRIGWTLLLQEFWEQPTWISDRFYSDEQDPDPGLGVSTAELPVVVELTETLPVVECREETAVIGITLAGIPLVTLRLPARRGRIQPQEIRRTMLMRMGFEFCRGVVRELILAPPAALGMSLRQALRAAAAERSAITAPPVSWVAGCEPRALIDGWQRAVPELFAPGSGGTLIGRRAKGADGTGISRYAVLPASSRAEMLAGAAHSGDPALELAGTQSASCVAYAPCVQWDRSSTAHLDADDEALMAHLEFEQLFAARPDPWNYASDYEQRKYDQTLSLVPRGVRRALEIGCAEGAFTVQLAGRVPDVLACDVSTVALSRAARRCSHLSNVTFMHLDLFEEELPSGYDLIVCSETLYYASSQDRLARTVRRLAQILPVGGFLLSANAHVLVDDQTTSGFDWDVPFGAKKIGESVLATGLFEHVEEVRTDPYRIQLFRRRGHRRTLSLRRRARGTAIGVAQAGEMSQEAASRYAPNGGEVRREREESAVQVDPRLPILMYHRIASAGAVSTLRWRIHPRDFEQQLEFLRAQGYYSLTFEQWRAAANMRRVLPGKPIILTFDDGYADFPQEVAPLLKRYGFSAMVFVVSELVGRSNVWDAELAESLPLMGWADIEELSREGIDFGSHSARHLPLVTLDQGQLAEDLARSKRLLEERLGHPITCVSYPFGLHDATVEGVAAACGYEFAVTTDEWPASWSDSLLSLPRLEVRGTDTIDEFAAMLLS